MVSMAGLQEGNCSHKKTLLQFAEDHTDKPGKKRIDETDFFFLNEKCPV